MPRPTPPGRASLVERRDLTPTLAIFRLALDGGVPAFSAGQFITLGAPGAGPDAHGEWRAYSIASPPHESRWIELYIRHALEPVPGVVTGALWSLAAGESLPHRGIAGAFTVEHERPDGSPDRRALLCVASGTGVAPFVSQALDLRHVDAPRTFVIVHGASHVRELGYDATLRELERETSGDAASPCFRFRYVPAISRPADPSNAGWSGETGRVETLLAPSPADGTCRLETILGERLLPDHWFAAACGFDATVRAVTSELALRGFVERRDRRADGSFDLKVESYG